LNPLHSLLLVLDVQGQEGMEAPLHPERVVNPEHLASPGPTTMQCMQEPGLSVMRLQPFALDVF